MSSIQYFPLAFLHKCFLNWFLKNSSYRNPKRPPTCDWWSWLCLPIYFLPIHTLHRKKSQYQQNRKCISHQVFPFQRIFNGVHESTYCYSSIRAYPYYFKHLLLNYWVVYLSRYTKGLREVVRTYEDNVYSFYGNYFFDIAALEFPPPQYLTLHS